MANNEQVIKSLNAQAYAGEYEANEGNYNVAGTFNTDGQKNINNVNGVVKSGDVQKVTFSAWKNGQQYVYSFNEIFVVSDLTEIAQAVEAAIATIESELASE